MFTKTYAKYRYSLILLRELVITEFKLRYQGSVLGYLWSLLRPLFLFIILYFVFVHFLQIGKDIPHWPVALLLGIVLWNFFSEVTKNGLKAIVSRGSLIKKLNFPKYIIIIAGTVSAFINLLLNMVIIIVFMIINGVEPSWSMLLFPLVVVQLFVFGLGMAFLLSTIYVKFRDIQHIWEILMQGLFYASAVIFPISRAFEVNPEIAKFLLLSPVAQTIQDARYVFVSKDLGTTVSMIGDPLLASVPYILSIVVFIVGGLYFKARSPYFAEEV